MGDDPQATGDGEAPSVSVIVPALDAEKTIGTCVESLLALDYPRDSVEIVIVDNGSTDRTREIVSAHPVKLLSETSVKTPAAPRNLGVRETSGEIVAFIDSDCEADPLWLTSAVGYFADESVGAVSGRIESAEPRSAIERYIARRASLSNERAFRHSFMPACVMANAVYRRDVFDRVGPFEQAWPCGCDIDFSWRMQADGGWRLLYEPAASVVHHHRTTLSSFYRQRRAWAIGAELLAAKWNSKLPRPRNYLARDLWHMAAKALLIPVTLPAAPVAPGLFWRQVIGLVGRAADIAGRRTGRHLATELVPAPHPAA